MTTLTPTKQSQAEDERDDIERRALTFFRRLYREQGERTLAVIDDADEAELERRIAELYTDEPARGANEFFRFWQPIAVAVGVSALLGLPGDAGGGGLNDAGNGLSDPFNDDLTRYLREMSRLFGDRYSQSSLEATFGVIQNWRDEGGTVADLRRQLAPVWSGPRPNAAATTETTRIVNQTRVNAWSEVGVWGYRLQTAGDGVVSAGGRVRDHHQERADNGPYPIGDPQGIAPVDGDVNCRCLNFPVVENPNAN